MEELITELAQMIRERVPCGCMFMPEFKQCTRCKLLERANKVAGE